MNQLPVKIKTHTLILNSINDRNYFSFKSNYLFRFKKSQKETKLTNIYSKQFLTNSPFLSNKKPVQIFFKTNYKNFLFFLLFNSANRHNSILKNISTNSDDSMFYSKNSLNQLKKPMKFFKKNKTHFLFNKPFQQFIDPTVVKANACSSDLKEKLLTLYIYPGGSPFRGLKPLYGGVKQQPISRASAKSFALTSKFKKGGGQTDSPFNFCLQKNLIKIKFNTLFLNLLKSSIQSNKIDLLNSNFMLSKMIKYFRLLFQQFSKLNQCNPYLLTQFITFNLAYSMLIVYINRHFRSEILLNRVNFLLTFINNFCKVKYLFLQMNRSFYYTNKDYDIFDSIKFFNRLNKNNVLYQTQFDWNLINATIFEFPNNICNSKEGSLPFLTKKEHVNTGFKAWRQLPTLQNKTMHSILIKKNFFLPVQATSKLQLMEFLKMNCAKNQFLKKFYLFYQKQIKQRNVISVEQIHSVSSRLYAPSISPPLNHPLCFTPSLRGFTLYPLFRGVKLKGVYKGVNEGVKGREYGRGVQRRKIFNLKKLLQEQLSNQIKLKLWKTSKKLHNQKSFNWVFKRYGLLINFYKQVKINFSWKQQSFFYKKNKSSKKSFNPPKSKAMPLWGYSFLKTQNIFFFKNLLKEKLEIGFSKKSLSKLLMFLIRKNLLFETLTSIENHNSIVIFLGQKNICFFKDILNLKTSHKLFLNLSHFLNLVKNQKNKYFYETYYFQN